MIREAAAADLPVLLEMGRDFHEESGWERFAEFDGASYLNTLRMFVETPSWRVLVWDDGGPQGFIIGTLVPLYFNQTVTVAHELLWWMRPGFRNGQGAQLLAAFHQDADIGVQTVSETTPRGEAVARKLQMGGWLPVERNFMKRLG